MIMIGSIGLMLVLLMYSGAAYCEDEAMPKSNGSGSVATSQYSPYAHLAYPTRVFWGDSHVHTSLSFDASAMGANLGPEEAYDFAAGRTVISSRGEPVALSRPLDWLAVTDHSDGLNLLAILGNPRTSFDGNALLSSWQQEILSNGRFSMATLMDLSRRVLAGNLPDAVSRGPAAQASWSMVIDAAEAAYRPGVFTSLIGYEWTPTVNGDNLHRNVIYREGGEFARQMLPFTVAESTRPEDLWQWMAGYESVTGGQVIAIPHNGNLSNGTMFPTFTGEQDRGRLTSAYAAARARWEPLYEVTQIKGDGEAHPYLSPEDEFADFERWDQSNLFEIPKSTDMLQHEYAREALKSGLRIQADVGANPYKFGLIGSTDSHTGLATAEENNFFGKNTLGEPGPARIAAALSPTPGQKMTNASYSASGYTGVWANENTREALFDAMKRREVFATTGPRIQLRFFGGWLFDHADFNGHDPARNGYAKGVPMGSDLPAIPSAGSAAPSFMVWALSDPDGARLDRIQVVKGWLDASGESHEKVFDVLCSDGRPVRGNRCTTELASTVDIGSAAWSDTVGAAELRTVWSDREFNPGEAAFYYLRAIEIPTPRWTVYDRARYAVNSAHITPETLQERAYSSPIWYYPDN